MIWLYSGTPGSGKSLHATHDILDRLSKTKYNENKFVICNYSLKTKSDKFFYMDNSDITPKFLVEFALAFHKIGVENQSLVVIDEASIFFNCRDEINKTRREWGDFFREHRKLGYNVILICQFDRMIDRQIRCFIEYEVVHRKLNNAGGFGLILNILHIPLFWTIQRWYGQKMVVGKGLMPFYIKASKAYNTFDLFSAKYITDDIKKEEERKKAAQAVINFATFLISEKQKDITTALAGRGASGVPDTQGRWYDFLFIDIFKRLKNKK